jgi:protease YdgD
LDTADGPVVVAINVGTYVQSKVIMQNGEVVHRFKASEIANTAVAIGQPASLLPLLMEADVLAPGARILELQRRLEQRGLYAGPFDGVHGLRLKGAIEDYQRAEQIPATGLPTRDLLARLGGGDATSQIVTGSISRSDVARAKPPGRRKVAR